MNRQGLVVVSYGPERKFFITDITTTFEDLHEVVEETFKERGTIFCYAGYRSPLTGPLPRNQLPVHGNIDRNCLLKFHPKHGVGAIAKGAPEGAGTGPAFGGARKLASKRGKSRSSKRSGSSRRSSTPKRQVIRRKHIPAYRLRK